MCWFDCCRLSLLVTLLGSTDRLVPTYRQHSLRLTAPTTGCYSYPAHYSLHASPPTHAGQPDSGPGWLSRLPCQPPPWRYKSPVATARGSSLSSPPHHILPSSQPSRVRAHITISSTTTLLRHTSTCTMIVTHHYVLVLALCRLAVDVRAAPATPSSAVDDMSNYDGLHAGAGVNVPEQVKDATNKVSLMFHVHVHLCASHVVPLPFCAHLYRHHTRG